MNPAVSYHLIHARIADLRRQRRRRPSPRAVLVIASIGAAVAFIDATIVNLAFPDIARSFPSTSISTLSWVLNAYNIVFAAFLMAAAGIADVLGRRRVFVFGLQLFTVGSLLCAIAPSADALIAFRMVQGLGAALLVPSALALVLHAYPLARRSHAVALLSAVGAAAAGLGPSLGGLLVAAANWRLVFVVNIPIGVAAALLARRLLAESRAPGRRRVPDLLGTLLFAFAMGTLVLGVAKGQEWHWDSARVIGCLVAALVLGAVVVWRCGRHRSPVFDLSLLRIRTFSVANAMMIVGAAGFYGYTLGNVLFLTNVWRYSILQAGLALTVGPVVAVAVAAPASRLAHRVGPRPVLVTGGLLWGAAVMWFVTRVGTTPVSPALGDYPELQGCDLVAFDPAPGALAGWAAALNPAGSHLIRKSAHDADVARMARRLAGASVGVVLSGGGARAFSHIGVLEELTRAGVTIDRVAGVSMGAVIGALFAMDHDIDEIDAICFEEWVRRRPLRDFTVPRHSLIRGERFQAMLHRTFGTRLIEELPRSFMSGSTELRSGRLEIARSGPLWEAVGFSINLPVIAPPQVRGRKLFIDGSLVDNLPVKAMADMAEGPIIAVDVKATPRRRESGLATARARIQRPPRPPALGETVARLLLLGSESTSESARRHADLVIRPRAEGVGLLEFDQLDAAREAGRAAAREALERAPSSLAA